MPSTYRKITEAVATRYAAGDPSVGANTFIRDTVVAGYVIVIGRTRSTYAVEGRVGRAGRNVRIKIGTVGRLAENDARIQAKAEVAKLAAGRDPVSELRANRTSKRVASVTFGETLDDMANGDLQPLTMNDYRRSIATLGWRDRKIATVVDEVGKAYKSRGDRATSAGRIFRSVRSIWNYARAKHPTLPAFPSSELKRVRKKWATAPRRQRTIPDALLPRWRKQVAKLEREDVRDLVLLLHFTGLRIGEARALDVIHIDLAAGCFLVANPKNKQPIKLPITTQLAPILRRRIRAVGTGPLFPFGDVRKSHASVDAAPWSYHDLRRQFITASHRCGVDDLIARALTNHVVPDADSHAGYAIFEADVLRPHAQRVCNFLDALGKVQTRKRGSPPATAVDDPRAQRALLRRMAAAVVRTKMAAGESKASALATVAELIGIGEEGIKVRLYPRKSIPRI